jgi:protein TonB
MPLLQDPAWYLPREIDVYPRPAVPVRPVYPARALDEGVGGRVTLLLLVDENGLVHEVSVVEAEPEGYFEESSVAAYQAARFEPARKDGRRVRSRILVRVLFDPEDR